ncbi:MAG TPA: GNAT family N-acetyltransferase [Cytophagales bacterium]|nr:GNAT family N-acetyltransferase [Cytophagales bacterium]HAA20902.1 GNAT family N-acetyltransferase [Cytophagales bacterium]HAP65198.1 GNAT family N-acetyltransferase [Cytophagales bacterium]
MKYKTFETERLLLRPTTVEDAEFIYELMNSPKWLKYIGDRNIRSVEDAATYIQERMLKQLERLGYSNYTVITKAGGEKIGSSGLYDREGLEGIDIGFAFLPQYEGKGYAFEASHRIKQAAFDDFDIEVLKAITIKDNVSSQKLLEKLGLVLEGTMRLPNDPEELLVYTIEKST